MRRVTGILTIPFLLALNLAALFILFRPEEGSSEEPGRLSVAPELELRPNAGIQDDDAERPLDSTPDVDPAAPTSSGRRVSFVLTGRVVDDSRRPVRAAAVTIYRADWEPIEVGTDSHGQFRAIVEANVKPSAVPWAAYVASGGGSARLIRFAPRPIEGLTQDLGTIALGVASPLFVLVRDGGKPAAQVSVRLVAEGQLLASSLSDTTGHVWFDELPDGPYVILAQSAEARVAQVRTRLPLPLEGSLDPIVSADSVVKNSRRLPIDLGPSVECNVEVENLATREPVSGAEVAIWSVLDVGTSLTAMDSLCPEFFPREPLLTDASGSCRVHVREAEEERVISVRASGYLALEHRLEKGANTVKLKLGPVVKNRFSIDAQDLKRFGTLQRVPLLPTLVLEDAAASFGNLEDGHLVFEAAESAQQKLWALAPDGTLAEVNLGHRDRPLRFLTPKRRRLAVIDEAGMPLPGVLCSLRNQHGAEVLAPVLTDDLGVAMIGPYLGDDLRVVLSSARFSGGELDLETLGVFPSESRAEDFAEGRVTLPKTRRLTLQFRHGDQDRLPADYDFDLERAQCVNLEEEWQNGLVRIELRPLPNSDPPLIRVRVEGRIVLTHSLDAPDLSLALEY